MTVSVHHGDSREVLKGFADASIDSVVCDPPYALVSIVKRFGGANAAPVKNAGTKAGDKGDPYARAASGFMGQKWDTGETAFAVEFWAEVYRVMKPGGHVIAFSGTRTYHRLACAIEDAGFEMRDMIAWLYGSGFPKSHDVSKGIDKAAGAVREVTGTRLKAGDIKGGALHSGSNVVGVTTEIVETAPATEAARQWQGWGTALKPALEPIVLARKPLTGTVAANVLAHGTGALNIDATRVGTGEERQTQTGGMGRKASPVLGAFANTDTDAMTTTQGRWPANVIHDGSEQVTGAFPDLGATAGGYTRGVRAEGEWLHAKEAGTHQAGFGDSGSAARFFYSAKADAADRCGSKHPTVKPVDLMAYLVRMVTPPGGVTLDPFAGSGSTGMACLREGFDCILIEREAQYVADIHKRLAHVEGADTPLFANDPMPGLFGDVA